MGFKEEQFVAEVNKRLKCRYICLDVLEDPYQCKNGHSFCKGCITRSLETRQTCPVCQISLRVKDLARCLDTKNTIEELEVYCHLPESDGQTAVEDEGKKLKCDWTGELQSLDKHKETCPFQQVQCTNEGCNTNMQRKELEDHDKICEHKLLKCDEQCGMTVFRYDLPNHKKNYCPEVRLACLNDCGTSIKRKDITAHRETCPYEQIKCPNVNCVKSLDRNKLEDHDKICGYKKVECGKCSKVLVRLEVEYHKYFECPEEMVPCPKSCRCPETEQPNKIKRVDSDWHMKNECAKTILDCPFKDQGCSVQVERQHVDKHVQDNMAAHMMLLAKQCSTLTKQCSSLTKQNSSLKKECSTLAQENRSLKQELNGIKETLAQQLSSTYTWTIRDFPELEKRHPNGSAFIGPCFWFGGVRFSLLVYPNGVRESTAGFLSLLLNVSEEHLDSCQHVISKISNNEIIVKHRLSVISQNRSTVDDVSYETTHVFTKPSSWGQTNLMKTTDARSPAYCSADGSLTIQCTIQLDKPQ